MDGGIRDPLACGVVGVQRTGLGLRICCERFFFYFECTNLQLLRLVVQLADVEADLVGVHGGAWSVVRARFGHAWGKEPTAARNKLSKP